MQPIKEEYLLSDQLSEWIIDPPKIKVEQEYFAQFGRVKDESVQYA